MRLEFDKLYSRFFWLNNKEELNRTLTPEELLVKKEQREKYQKDYTAHLKLIRKIKNKAQHEINKLKK